MLDPIAEDRDNPICWAKPLKTKPRRNSFDQFIEMRICVFSVMGSHRDTIWVAIGCISEYSPQRHQPPRVDVAGT
jgi:hypothetical protein